MTEAGALYFLAAGFSVLRFLESWNDKASVLRPALVRVLLDEFLFFTAMVLPALIYFAGLKIFPAAADLAFLGMFPGLYFVFRAAGRPDSFAAGAFAFLSVYVFPLETLHLLTLIRQAAFFACAVLIFRFALMGLRFRLLFCNVPRSLRGAAVFLAAAGWVSLALSAVFLRL
jgi:hypothetical protein